MSENNLDMELDALLDMDLDDLSDEPSFAAFPKGLYRVLLSMEKKDINDKTAYEVSLKMQEVVELASEDSLPPNPGDTCTALYFPFDKEGKRSARGEGGIKRVAAAVAAVYGRAPLRDLIEKAQDFECIVATSQRKNKNDPDNPYLHIEEILVNE